MHPAVIALLLAACSKPTTAVETEPQKGAFDLGTVLDRLADGERVKLDRREVPLAEMDLARFFGGLPVSGKADVAIDLAIPGGDLRHAAGSIAMTCTADCKLGDDATKLAIPQMGELTFGHLGFDKVDVRVELGDGRARVARWQIQSPDLALDISLDVALAAKLPDSQLDGCIRYKATPELAKRDPKLATLLAATGAPRAADGTYSMKIGGTVKHRKVLGQPCG